MQLFWEWVVCPVLGNGGLLPAAQTLLKSATGNQQKVSNPVHNTAPAQIQAPEGRGSKNCPWKVIAHWMKNKIVLITLRIFFASLEMVIFAASKVDCKYQVSEKLSVAVDNS